MELKDFIAETLTQIVAGVVDARTRVTDLDANARVNPFLDPMREQLMNHGFSLAGGDVVQFVSFEVSVTTKDEKGKKGGAGVFVAPLSFGATGQSAKENIGNSRLSFRVPLVLPRETCGE